MNKKNNSIGLLGAALLLPLSAMNALADGTPLNVNPAVILHPGAPSTGSVTRSGTTDMYVYLKNSCFGTNLRRIGNPLAPSSLIKANLKFNVQKTESDPGTTVDIWVKYPAILVTKTGLISEAPTPVDPSNFGGMAGMKVEMYGNVVRILVPAAPANVTLDPDGKIELERQPIPPVSLIARSFEQILQAGGGHMRFGGGRYMGKDGELTSTVSGFSVAPDNSGVEMSVAFPGQNGFCGGYYSPLMLFFDEARPKFTGSSDFRLSAASRTYWVEAGSPGHFLAIDSNGDGKIDNKEELFGDQDLEDGNGFVALGVHDSNKDGMITAKDKKFGKLLLWNDANGNGVSDDGELEPLSKRVTKISLKYKRGVKSYGQTAEARQSSEFWFKDGGKTKKAVVEDIWFNPVPGTEK